MKKPVKFILYTMIAVVIGWLVLTVYAEMAGPKKSWHFGNATTKRKVLVVYDPDPFYNFDEQVCIEFAKVLSANGMKVNVVSVAAARELEPTSYDLFVFCANTYNWGPDWALSRYISDQPSLAGKPVIAITLGSGSTGRSQKKLEQRIVNQNGKIIGSRSLWLLRPNDEGRMKESNVAVALSIVNSWANSMAIQISQSGEPDNYHLSD